MRYSIMALTSGAFEEIRLPAFSDADYQSCLSAKRLGLKKYYSKTGGAFRYLENNGNRGIYSQHC